MVNSRELTPWWSFSKSLPHQVLTIPEIPECKGKPNVRRIVTKNARPRKRLPQQVLTIPEIPGNYLVIGNLRRMQRKLYKVVTRAGKIRCAQEEQRGASMPQQVRGSGRGKEIEERERVRERER